MKATEVLRRMDENRKNLEFLPTGFPALDKQLDGGFLKKEIIIVGAFTGVGKSVFGGQVLYQIASKGFKTAYFSLEISNEMILSRLVGQLSNIKPTRIFAGLLDVEEIDRKSEARAKICLYDEDMDFYDNHYLMEELEKSIRENKYEFVVIDFIQNIQMKNNMEEYARLSFLSIHLQKLAKETNCCIVVLSQLSNKVGRDGSKVVEYKGSGAIAMVADLGFFLERENPQVDSFGQPIGEQVVRLSLRKNRRGISGIYFDLKFIHPGGLLIEKI